METNIGTIDQMIRIAGLIICAFLYVTETLTGFVGTIMGLIAIYCFVTALTRYSPVWEMLGISTEKKFHKIIH
ncbi:MAG: DUF2892 domain-containing protein [Bacteriovoracaceae bacterium]|nr:DUF2892 domain-containing protein [Bacteroidota bacterium]